MAPENPAFRGVFCWGDHGWKKKKARVSRAFWLRAALYQA
jgi:hypothetical protein